MVRNTSVSQEAAGPQSQQSVTPFVSTTQTCRAKVADAIYHCIVLAQAYPAALTVHCISLPAVKAAQEAMDRAALQGDVGATTRCAKQYYRVWRDVLTAATEEAGAQEEATP